ncbi:MAG: flagellar hook capping protein [Planctomycetota bacterium]|nr:flagellar hook capping protein [Planctomycetaceae bacterium]MDQ3332758.1 flagellar hook capping protein [Planctomycetota bacterium]
MAVSGVGNAPNATVIPPDKTGFNALTSADFLKLLVTQLQNQDPTEPVGNEELLNQLSMMRSLQSNIELGEAVKSVSSNQNLSMAAGFIGKTVKGSLSDGTAVTGVVDSAFLADGAAYVKVSGQSVALSRVLEVASN